MTETDQRTSTPLLGRRDLWSAAGFLIVTAAVYYKTLFFGDLYFDGDLSLYNGPHYHYSAQRLRHLALPLWNPYLYGGTPFLANPETGVFYPPTWIALVLPVEWAVTLLAISHQLLGAALTFLFCRLVLRVRRVPSFIAGLVFGYSGYLPAHFEQTSHLMSAAWLPGILLAYLRARQTGRVAWHVACGLMIAAAILAGGVQNVYMICLALVLCGLGAALHALRTAQPRRVRAVARPLAAVAAAGLIAAGAAAAQLVPTLQFLPQSSRSGRLPFHGAASYSLPLAHAPLFLLCPHFFGHEGATYWGVWRQHELTVYAGILPLLLAIAAAVFHCRERYVPLLTILAVSALCMALGDSTPLYTLAYRWLPGVAWFRAPVRFGLLFGFAVAALAAIALDRLLAGKPPRSWRRLLAALAVAWIALALAACTLLMRADLLSLLVRIGMPSKDRDALLIMQQITSLGAAPGAWWNYYLRTFAWTLLLLAAAWMVLALLVAAGEGSRSRRAVPWCATAALALVIADLLVFNTGLAQVARAGAGRDTRRRFDWIAYLQENRRHHRCELPADYPPNRSMFHDLPVADGYGAFLPQRRYLQLAQARDKRAALDRWRELFAIACRVRPAGGSTQPATVFQSTQSKDEVLFDAMRPRARLVFNTRWQTGPEALQTVFDPAFDPSNVVVLEGTPQTAKTPPPRGPLPQPYAAAQVTFAVDAPEHLRLHVTAPKPGYLIVADAFYPGWRARVAGRPATILRANGYFRAVPVPAGRSVVELRYADRLIGLGIGISAMTWLAALGWCIASAHGSRYAHRAARSRWD